MQALVAGKAAPSAQAYSALVGSLREIGAGVSAGFEPQIEQLDATISGIESQMNMELTSDAVAEYISQIETGLAEGEKQLAAAEKALYDSRAQIWYEMGKLEDKEVELEEGRKQLLQEEQDIISKTKLSEEQKQREKRLRSLYLTFADKDEIAEDLSNNEPFTESVEKYINKFSADADMEAKYRGYANILMIAALPAALICMLAGFEAIKKPRMIRRGAFLITLCSAGALGIFLWLGRGVSYSAAAVVFFAVIQFMVSGIIKKKV